MPQCACGALQGSRRVRHERHQPDKLESYIRPGSTEQAQFYVDVEGHVEAPEMRLAMEELRFYCEDGAVTILGTYPASAVRGSN